MPSLNFADILLSLPAFILALTVHEYSHAKVADMMGDPTPRLAGRLTLEPWAHLDPIGTLLLILYRFGWAKPVPINPRNFRDPRRGILYTSLAGPLSNFAMAIITVFLWALAEPLISRVGHLSTVFQYILVINVYFGVFNLIPLPPLDGSKVLMALLPGRQAYAFSRLEPYGPIILIVFLIVGPGRLILGTVGDFIIRALLTAGGFLATVLRIGG